MRITKERGVCDVETGWCEAMNESLALEANDGKRGLTTLRLINFDTAKMSFGGIMYNSTGSRKTNNPLMLNYCPWCGADLAKYWQKFEKKPAKKRKPKNNDKSIT